MLLTNVLAHHLGKQFVMVENGAVLEIKLEMQFNSTQKKTGLFDCCQGLLHGLVWLMAWIQAKIETSLDDSLLWNLRHRGHWIKKDNLKIFYTDLNDRGVYFAVFLTIKNVIIGVVLADQPPLLDTIQKVCILFLMTWNLVY